MSNKNIGKIIVAAILVAALAFTGVVQPALSKYVSTVTGGMTISEFAVNLLNNSFSLVVENVKATYERNEAFQPAVKVEYTDGRGTKTLNGDQYEITQVDMSKPGIKMVTITYEENGKIVTSALSFKVNAINSIMAEPTQDAYDVGTIFKPEHFNVTAVTNEGIPTKVTNFEIVYDQSEMESVGDKIITIKYNDGGTILTTTCTVNITKLRLLSVNYDAWDPEDPGYHRMWFFRPGGYNVSGWLFNYPSIEIEDDDLTEYYGGNQEKLTGYQASWNLMARYHDDCPTAFEHEYLTDNNWYGLTIENALPYTTLGINCLVGYDAPIVGFGYYIDNDLTTLQWNPPALRYTDEAVVNIFGPNNGYALTQFSLYGFKPGEEFTVHWVVVFEDGIQKLSDWHVKMKPASSTDEVFTDDPQKPNVNVIIMAGQSNMYGVAPITEEVQRIYGSRTYPNVKILYKNINYDTPTTLKTIYSNGGFDAYQVGIGGQSDTHFGPEMALAATLADVDALRAEEWYIIKYSAAGTFLQSQWLNNCSVDGKTTTLAQDMISYVQETIDDLSRNYDVRIRSFMWMQGESDAEVLGSAQAYGTLEKELVTLVRNSFAKYATRSTEYPGVPGSGISFINAGIAVNDTDLKFDEGGPNNWVYAEIVNAGKVSNSEYFCYGLIPDASQPLPNPYSPIQGPLTGINFNVNGTYSPTCQNPNQSGVIKNSIYLDTSYLTTKYYADDEKATYPIPGDDIDWAHYGVTSMLALGGLFASGLHYMIMQQG